MAALASLSRIEDLLKREEKNDRRQDSTGISANSASFGYSEHTLLKDIAFELPNKKITMIVGQVGSVSIIVGLPWRLFDGYCNLG